jgi:hypothetical protein
MGRWRAAIRRVKEKVRALSILTQVEEGNDSTFQGCTVMSKRELIDCICEINRGAKPEFLASFSEEDLSTYLEHLMELDLEELAVCC